MWLTISASYLTVENNRFRRYQKQTIQTHAKKIKIFNIKILQKDFVQPKFMLQNAFVTWKTERQWATSLSNTSKTHPASSEKSTGIILPCLCETRTSMPLIPAKHISNRQTIRPPSLISCPAHIAPSLTNSCVALKAFFRSSTFWTSGLSLPEKKAHYVK